MNSFSNYVIIRKNNKFIDQFNDLCENIIENKILFDSFWENEVIPALLAVRDENLLLEHLNNVIEDYAPSGKPKWMEYQQYLQINAKRRQMGLDPLKGNESPQQVKEEMSAQKPNNSGLPPAVAQRANQPGGQAKPGQGQYGKYDQAVKLVGDRFQQSMKSFYKSIEQDAHKMGPDGKYAYEVAKKFSDRITQVGTQTLAGAKSNQLAQGQSNPYRQQFTQGQQQYQQQQQAAQNNIMGGQAQVNSKAPNPSSFTPRVNTGAILPNGVQGNSVRTVPMTPNANIPQNMQSPTPQSPLGGPNPYVNSPQYNNLNI